VHTPASVAHVSIGQAALKEQDEIGLFGAELNGQPTDVGIIFFGKVGMPGGTEFPMGSWRFVQTICPTGKLTRANETTWHWLNNGKWGLDNKVPVPDNIPGYPFNSPGSAWLADANEYAAADRPSSSSIGPDYLEDSIDDKFRTRMMFKPAGDGRWVPLREVSWSVNVRAVFVPNPDAFGHWEQREASQSASDFDFSVEFPQWDLVIKNSDPFMPDL
jgi:hypothetical protein